MNHRTGAYYMTVWLKFGVDAAGSREVSELVAGRAYHWKEWCLARGRDCLYIWSDAAALELSNGSNGWFR